MNVVAKTIEELIEKSGDQKESMIELDKLVRQIAPDLKRKLYSTPSITMIGYGEMPYKTSTYDGMWPLICLAPQKGSTNLYLAGEKDGEALPKYYAKKLGKVSCGKSCIRVKKVENLNLDALEQMIKDAIIWLEAKEKD